MTATRLPGPFVRARVDIAVGLVFVALTLAYAWPLLGHLSDRFAHDPGDPALNAWILKQGTDHLPFSAAWFNPPVFFPAIGAITYSEHLLGLVAFAWVLDGAGAGPILTYNAIFLLTFVLSAGAAYWMAFDLTGSRAAGLVAGLAFGFSPYRSSQLAHLQVLASFFMPVVLLAMHRYLRDGRRRWLAVFACAWLFQALTNGHFLFYFGIVVGGWLVWHGARPSGWRRGSVLAAVWLAATVVAGLSYVPYLEVHELYGFARQLHEIEIYSAPLEGLGRVTSELWLWGGRLPEADGETQLFPGLTLMVVIAIALVLSRNRDGSPNRMSRATLVIGTLAGIAATVTAISAWTGPWEASVLGVRLSVTGLYKPITIVLALLAVAGLTSQTFRRLWREQSQTGFFLIMAVACFFLALGPTPLAFGERWLYYAPYRWLMAVPGIDGLRVPTRIWMPATLMLAAAGATLWASLMAGRRRRTVASLTVLVCAGILADGWVHPFRMAPDSRLAYGAPAPAPGRVVVEFPVGEPYQEVAAMLRASLAGNPTANGYSGHHPPHYNVLRFALRQCDVSVLDGVARFGDVTVITDPADISEECRRDLVALGTSSQTTTDGRLRVDVDRRPPAPARAATRRLRPIGLNTSIHGDLGPAMIDDDLVSRWHGELQDPDDWVELDLGAILPVTGVALALGEYVVDYPRELEVDVSTDGLAWTSVSRARGAALAFEAAVGSPLNSTLAVTFPRVEARHVRLRQLGFDDTYYWSIAELWVLVDE